MTTMNQIPVQVMKINNLLEQRNNLQVDFTNQDSLIV